MTTTITATITQAGRWLNIAVGDELTQAHSLDEVAPMTESLIRMTQPELADFTVNYVWPPIYLEPDLAAHYAGVEPATLRAWVHRGHIDRHNGQYEKGEIDAWLARRDQRKIKP